jgi:bifunctional DNA-binding transcriptional regulator/antitoxin component of YhaV-PrlF toxin-antitoxin module
MNKSWTLTVGDEGILELPTDLLEEAGWKEGDVINWIDNHDGTWSLVKEDLTNFIHKGIINNEQN